MAVVELVALAAGQSLTDTGEPGQDHDWPVGFDGELIKRLPQRIACRHFGHLTVDTKPDEAGVRRQGAIEFADQLERAVRLELQPMPEDNVRVGPLHGEGVIVMLAYLADRQEFGE